ncbi:dTDP-4-dehydrorhamnose reductase [Engelhardtia mirabilis]|uniref:dTDP-4-dehydrorhamnose reductase n=1 Tax=Engelhardtia mirabilis TaxID=2528011 RepID=A0A518BKC1_9BACT|nr:dTDP-4-dehydrorhamnose reductase [Planctomycetes bacterium Pla133]QDV01750.1 dTDP-4-dehydrorhamnose reductase [Planctomycetes bacterium Pla86]
MLGSGTTGRVLVTGARGMLGGQLLADAPQGLSPVGTDRSAEGRVSGLEHHGGVDLTVADAVERLFDCIDDLVGVIHPAAYTAVDKAEEEPGLARAVNAAAAQIVARACASRGLPLVVVSTDFVFDGTGERPYREDDAPNPTSVYGATKLEGEQLALAANPGRTAIVRTQWLYGPGGNHFPGTMLRLASERDQLRVVSDQVGSPTSTLELSPALWDVLVRGAAGVYHAACEGRASWYDLAVATLAEAGVTGVKVDPCTTDEFPRPAKRPAYSVLDCSKLAALRGAPLAPWREALARFLAHERA